MKTTLSKNIKIYALSFFIFFSGSSFAAANLSTLEYYGVRSEADFDTLARGTDFKRHLGDLIKDGHFRTSYKGVRKFIFGELDLRTDRGGYYVECVYCELKFHSGDSGVGSIGPGKIPNNNMLNVEHTWPQSRFGGRDSGFQKIDAHHLFPSTSRVNGIRGNDEFGEVGAATQEPCTITKKGSAEGGTSGRPVFEPPHSHKGNVARALFYFAVRYNVKISEQEETFLRAWHEEDPVTEDDRLRNEMIYEYQGNRNPFIDHPAWADAIADF